MELEGAPETLTLICQFSAHLHYIVLYSIIKLEFDKYDCRVVSRGIKNLI